MPEPTVPARPTSRRRLLMLAPLGVAVAGGVAFRAMLRGMETGWFDPHAVPSPLVGRPPPAFSLPGRDGSTLDAAGLRAPPRPVLVNFFASWCLPCREEADALAELAQGRAQAGTRAGIPIWGIAYKDKPDAVAGFLARTRDPYVRLGYDEAGETAIDWGVTGVPESFVVDRAGIIRWHWSGPLPPALLPMIRKLAA